MQKIYHRHINTSLLKDRHKKIYQILFQNCPIVVSAPIVYPLSPNYAVGPGGIGVVAKLPFRLYLGIEPTTAGRVKFGPTFYYLPEKDIFSKWETSRCSPIFLKVLENFSLQNNKKVNARLWALCEMPWYRGLNIDSIYAISCATAWHLYLKLISSKKIKELVSRPSFNLYESEIFKKIFQLAMTLEAIIGHVLPDGHLAFAALIKSKYPVIFFREKDPILFDQFKDFGIEHPSSYYNIFKELFYQGLRMEEIFPFEPNPFWPIDMALIFSGEEFDSRAIFPVRKALKSKLEEEAKFSKENLEKLIPKIFRERLGFLKIMKGISAISSGMNLFKIYRSCSVVHSITVFKSLYDLFQYKGTPSILREFVDAQNLNQDILRILGLSPFVIDRVCTIIREVGANLTETGIATRLVGPGGGGCIMVFGPLNSLDSILTTALPLIKKNTPKTVHCHWASWCDGNFELGGIKVEQNIEEGIYPDFVEHKSLAVKILKRGEKLVMFFTPEKWKKDKKKFDLLLNAKERRIYVRGRLLTSSNIHSARQTIEVFKALFNKKVMVIKGSDLPRSCYRQDRNQMESKVIRPLRKIFKKITGRELGLEIYGGVASNYEIKFKPSSKLKIALIE